MLADMCLLQSVVIGWYFSCADKSKFFSPANIFRHQLTKSLAVLKYKCALLNHYGFDFVLTSISCEMSVRMRATKTPLVFSTMNPNSSGHCQMKEVFNQISAQCPTKRSSLSWCLLKERESSKRLTF